MTENKKYSNVWLKKNKNTHGRKKKTYHRVASKKEEQKWQKNKHINVWLKKNKNKHTKKNKTATCGLKKNQKNMAKKKYISTCGFKKQTWQKK